MGEGWAVERKGSATRGMGRKHQNGLGMQGGQAARPAWGIQQMIWGEALAKTDSVPLWPPCWPRPSASKREMRDKLESWGSGPTVGPYMLEWVVQTQSCKRCAFCCVWDMGQFREICIIDVLFLSVSKVFLEPSLILVASQEGFCLLLPSCLGPHYQPLFTSQMFFFCVCFWTLCVAKL